MTKVDLSLESKSKVSLTLEDKGENFTWATVPGTWAEHTSDTWETQKQVGLLESKSKVSLSLEAK